MFVPNILYRKSHRKNKSLQNRWKQKIDTHNIRLSGSVHGRYQHRILTITTYASQLEYFMLLSYISMTFYMLFLVTQ